MSERILRKMKPSALTNAAKATPTSVAVIDGSMTENLSQVMKLYNRQLMSRPPSWAGNGSPVRVDRGSGPLRGSDL